VARKKISTTVYLDSSSLAALHELSERTKVPMARLIRDAIDEMLAARGQRIPTPVGQPYGAAVS